MKNHLALFALNSVVSTFLFLSAGTSDALASTFSPTLFSSVRAQSGGINSNSPLDSRSSSFGTLLTARSDYAYQDSLLGSASASSSAFAEIGALHVSAASNSSVSAPVSTQYVAGSNSGAVASIGDRFIIHSASQTDGSKGTMTIAIGIDGTVTGAGDNTNSIIGPGHTGGWNGTAWWQVQAQISSTKNEGGYGGTLQTFGDSFTENQSGVPHHSGPSTFGLQYLTFDFIFGSSIYTNLRAETFASSGASNDFFAPSSFSSAFLADLSHTISWRGITNVLDANGNPVNNYTALSDVSGFNYAQGYSSVPLPASMWTFFAGLLALIFPKTRRS